MQILKNTWIFWQKISILETNSSFQWAMLAFLEEIQFFWWNSNFASISEFREPNSQLVRNFIFFLEKILIFESNLMFLKKNLDVWKQFHFSEEKLLIYEQNSIYLKKRSILREISCL